MISSAPDESGLLLIAGDISHTPLLIEMFYKELSEQWKGLGLSVLGNHELWYYGKNSDIKKVKNEIQIYYKRIINQNCLLNYSEILLLENEVYIVYKNRRSAILNEEILNHINIESLKTLLDDSLFILIAGNGFSGLNPKYNAESGLYKNTLTSRIEDRVLADRISY